MNKNGNVITVTRGGNVLANADGELEFCIGADSKNEISDMWLKNNGIKKLSIHRLNVAKPATVLSFIVDSPFKIVLSTFPP